MKKVLVVSYMALMDTTANGRTMKSLIQGLDRENVCTFNVVGIPDADACCSAYKISNSDALKSILKLKEFGNPINIDGIAKDVPNKIQDNEIRQTPKNAWKYLIREMCWLLGKTKGKRFKAWLKEQKPDCVVYMYADSPSLQNLSVWISNFLNIPLIVYTCENYCFKDYNYIDHKKHSLPFYIYHRMSLKATRRMFDYSTTLIANSDELGELFLSRYSSIKDVFTVTMASNMDFNKNAAVVPVENVLVVYMGNLAKYRATALVDIAEALFSIDNRLRLSVYGRTNDPEILEMFEACPGLEYCGFVPYDEVVRITKHATLNIEAINIDTIIAKNKKYGLSTKFADAVACGTPFLLYAPKEMVESIIATKNSCAFVVNDKNDLVDTLKAALFDFEKREQQLNYAKITKDKFFDNKINIETFNRAIEAAFDR